MAAWSSMYHAMIAQQDKRPFSWETVKRILSFAQPQRAQLVGFLVLIVLLIFIAQNTESAVLHFLGWNWSLPLGVSILAAAVLGGLITVLAGAVRIFQLRRAAKKNYKAAIR